MEVDRAPEGEEEEVKITVTKPARKREAVGVGAKGGELPEDAGDGGSGDAGPLPDDPDVLPDVPDTPPDDQ